MPTGETLAVETPPPVPPPPPTPTATASASPASARHRRHRTFSSSSSSSSSSLSTVSSAASSPSPSPSPRVRGTTTTTTSVPFSWEHHPGIPKTRLIPAGTLSSAPTPLPLPLPPPLRAPTTTSRPRHHHHARHRRASGKPRTPADDAADPFAAALAECTRERAAGAGPDDAGLMNALFPARAPPAPTSRLWSSIASAGGVVGLLDLYGCKSALGGGVAEGAFVVRRSVAVVRAVPAGRAGLGRAGRR